MYFHTRRGAPSTPRLCFCGLGGTEPPIVATPRHQYGGSRGFQPPHKANKSTSGFSPGGMACGSISPLARFVRHFLERLAYCRNLAGPCRRLNFRAANPPGPAHSRTLRRFRGVIVRAPPKTWSMRALLATIEKVSGLHVILGKRIDFVGSSISSWTS
jgi:hypothetical protein